jgi:GNAT superfamily N-acetyltransferase
MDDGRFLFYTERGHMSFTVRRAVAEDMDELLRLCEERREVYLKAERRMLPFADAQNGWRESVLSWLARDDAAVMVAARDEALIGYIIGWVWHNPPATEPQKFGLVSEMTVDGHCKQGGVGTAMFDGLKDWFRENKLDVVEVRVPRVQPIEQAFWRAIGAQPFVDHMYYRIEK